MRKFHLAALYAGLAVAIAGVVFLWGIIVELQERQDTLIAGLEEQHSTLVTGLEEWQSTLIAGLEAGLEEVDQVLRDDLSRIAGLEERQAALTRWSVGVDGNSESVANDIAGLRRSVSGYSSRISAVERQLRSLGSRPTQQVVTPGNPQGLDELETALSEWAEGVDDWRIDYARWRNSVESRLQCAIPPSVIVDIVAVVRGDLTKIPGLIRQAQTTTRCLS